MFNALGSAIVLPSCGGETEPGQERDPGPAICGPLGGTVEASLANLV